MPCGCSGPGRRSSTRSPGECFVDDAPPLADGLIEGLRYRREQAVSRTLHRFGNVIAPQMP